MRLGETGTDYSGADPRVLMVTFFPCRGGPIIWPGCRAVNVTIRGSFLLEHPETPRSIEQIFLAFFTRVGAKEISTVRPM